MASRGLRDLDGGAEKIGDAAELAQVKRQRKKVYVESLLTAVLLTLLAVASNR